MQKVKKAAVESYVAAIALGWIFAQAVLHLAYVFSAPVAGWIARREYRDITHGASATASLCLQDSLPELVKCVFLFAIGYGLLRWLYFKPVRVVETTESDS